MGGLIQRLRVQVVAKVRVGVIREHVNALRTPAGFNGMAGELTLRQPEGAENHFGRGIGLVNCDDDLPGQGGVGLGRGLGIPEILARLVPDFVVLHTAAEVIYRPPDIIRERPDLLGGGRRPKN